MGQWSLARYNVCMRGTTPKLQSIMGRCHCQWNEPCRAFRMILILSCRAAKMIQTKFDMIACTGKELDEWLNPNFEFSMVSNWVCQTPWQQTWDALRFNLWACVSLQTRDESDSVWRGKRDQICPRGTVSRGCGCCAFSRFVNFAKDQRIVLLFWRNVLADCFALLLNQATNTKCQRTVNHWTKTTWDVWHPLPTHKSLLWILVKRCNLPIVGREDTVALLFDRKTSYIHRLKTVLWNSTRCASSSLGPKAKLNRLDCIYRSIAGSPWSHAFLSPFRSELITWAPMVPVWLRSVMAAWGNGSITIASSISPRTC